MTTTMRAAGHGRPAGCAASPFAQSFALISPAELGPLLRQHQAQMRRVALRLCRDPAEADDAVQEACLLAVVKLSQYRGDAPFHTWLHRVTVNAALMHLRRRRRARLWLVGDFAEPTAPRADRIPEPIDDAANPEDRSAGRQHLARVAVALSRLNPALRDTLLLREVGGLSGAAVADRLNRGPGQAQRPGRHERPMSAAAVKTRVCRARTALRALLARHVGTP